MVIFHSFLYVYQRVSSFSHDLPMDFPMEGGDFPAPRDAAEGPVART